MGWMFQDCNKLTNLILGPNFTTAKVINMDEMFEQCRSLTTLNLCTFDTRNVKNMGWMFSAASNLKTIKVGTNWNTSNAVIDGMFNSCGTTSVTKGQC